MIDHELPLDLKAFVGLSWGYSVPDDEFSVGYEAHYDQIAPGRGQRTIVANHVTLVDEARCGPRCAIGDSAREANRLIKFGTAQIIGVLYR